MKKSILLFAGLAFLIFKNQAQTITDYDGNIYNIVTIGKQDWMKENLKVTHYNNGASIPLVTDNSAWSILNSGAYAYYNNDINYMNTYGGLYNWHTLSNSNLCPVSWHVPSDGDWTILFDYLINNGYGYEGSGNDIAKSLAATSGWTSNGTNGTVGNNQGSNNSTGYTAFPSGERGLDGVSYDIGILGLFWSSFETDINNAHYIYLSSYNAIVVQSSFLKNAGLSVRCIKDTVATNIYELNNKKEVQLFPNPAFDKININCFQRQDLKMQIYTIIGECILQRDLNNGTNIIDITSLSKGVYLVRLIGANCTFQRKFIKD